MSKTLYSNLARTDLLVIDNVNERSGAPIALSQVFKSDLYHVACVRANPNRLYNESINGIVSKYPLLYPFALVSLLLKFIFIFARKKPKLLVSNTILTSPISLYFFLRGVKVLTWIHETPNKSLFYRFMFWLSLKTSHTVITPSRVTFIPFLKTFKNWSVVPNLISLQYYNYVPSTTHGRLHVLFLGGNRAVKGYYQYLRIKTLANESVHANKITFTDNLNGNIADIPYHQNDILLVLTDNRLWRETFGLVGLEAAASGCIPFFTDAFAYYEIWRDFPELSLVGISDHLIFSQLLFYMSHPDVMKRLKLKCQDYAKTFADPTRVISLWSKEIDELLSC